MSEKKNEQVEQVEQNETEIELEVKPVKSLKTNLKGGLLSEEAGFFDFARPTSGRNCYCELESGRIQTITLVSSR